ncbi:MAG: hypothetical protein RJA24_981 [Pseudomonadota bacterium]|jgi:Na+/H+ antiporter NhaD/arsenite permease-like protein
MHQIQTGRRVRLSSIFCAGLLFSAFSGFAAAAESPAVFGIPLDFILFGMTLLGVALFHKYTLQVALTGLIIIALYKVGFTGFKTGDGIGGLLQHLFHEWVIIVNLFCLLVGFALLSNHFERSHLPLLMPRYLPDDWKGAFALLVIIWVMSGFLDNIAAALIGGTLAATLFRRKVHIGYLAAIVAASNAGGAGSVVGDTTTTMMWLDGVDPRDVLHAYVAAAAALIVVAIPASLLQQKYSPIVKDEGRHAPVDWVRIGIVVAILAAAILTNVLANLKFHDVVGNFPAIGVAVWVVIIACTPLRKPDWGLVPEAAKGSIFLLSLVLCASMMPVEKLPPPSWQSAFALGFISSVFDNIPLTALALKQGGYDWGVLAYAVGFGGSMIWFGSSAGVALSNMYPEARSVGLWLRHGWFVPIAYIVGFFVMLGLLGWEPHEKHKVSLIQSPASVFQVIVV